MGRVSWCARRYEKGFEPAPPANENLNQHVHLKGPWVFHDERGKQWRKCTGIEPSFVNDNKPLWYATLDLIPLMFRCDGLSAWLRLNPSGSGWWRGVVAAGWQQERPVRSWALSQSEVPVSTFAIV